LLELPRALRLSCDADTTFFMSDLPGRQYRTPALFFNAEVKVGDVTEISGEQCCGRNDNDASWCIPDLDATDCATQYRLGIAAVIECPYEFASDKAAFSG